MTELSGRTVNYGYDSIYRLASESIASDLNNVNGAASYVYNNVGNRTQKASTIPGYAGGLTNYNANDQLTIDTYDYDAFGNLLHSTGTTFNEFLFAGEQFDSDLGLYYNRARYLNVSTGRFWTMDSLEPDPIDPFSLHRYLYVDVNPVDGVDPSGHEDLNSLSFSEGISEEVDATEAEAEFTAKKALSLKVIDIYHCEKFQAYIIPFHCWVYANQPGDWGFRYDIGAEKSERGPGLILGSVSGYLLIRETTLNAVRSDATATFSKEASLSELGWVEWQALIVADFEFLGLVEGGAEKYVNRYSFNTLIPEAVNCLFFTGFAIFAAKRIQNSGH